MNIYSGLMPDKRLEVRAGKIMSSMIMKETAILHQLSESHSEQIGSYRFFNNENITLDTLKQGVYNYCAKNSKDKHVLCIQDTTEFNYESIKKKLGKLDKNIGPVRNKINPGFFLHANIVLDTNDYYPLGLSSLIEWNRDWDKKNKFERKYNKLDITEKESYRWISSISTSKNVLNGASSITVIGDRESDIYEELVYVPDNKTNLLIRSSINRCLYGEKLKLFQYLDSKEIISTYKLEVKGNKKRIDRIAEIDIKYSKVKILKTKKKGNESLPEFKELWAIECKESKSTIPDGEDPIHWRLLTTHEINNLTDVFKYIEWYAKRWEIEQFFRVMKSKGLNIEGSQLGDGLSLKRLMIFSSQVAILVLQLTIASDKNNKKSAKLMFTDDEIIFMKQLCSKLEGKSDKLKNKLIPGTLSWASWVIARLGGWKGYESQAPPGHITILNGIKKFYQQYEGWMIALKVFKGEKDVYRE